MSGRKGPCIEEDSADVADYQKIIAPWLLIVSVIRLAAKTLQL